MKLDVGKATELKPGALYCIETDTQLSTRTMQELERYLKPFVEKYGVDFLILEPPYTLAKYVAELIPAAGSLCPPHEWEAVEEEDSMMFFRCIRCQQVHVPTVELLRSSK